MGGRRAAPTRSRSSTRQIGQGTYSNVYKARDTLTGKIVALKKVRFDNLEMESVKFMAREILVLRRLDHPNVVKLEGLVTSRMTCSLYLVFEYMEHDLAGLAASPSIKFTEPQVKCYMHQLLSGLEHCHNRGVLHRDIKGSNLLLDNTGTLKIADFGLASFFDPNHKQPMTSRVVTLWYRPPELLLGPLIMGSAWTFGVLDVSLQSFWLESQLCLAGLRLNSCTKYLSYVVPLQKSIGRSQNCHMPQYLSPNNHTNGA
ncbi:putative protein kinase superfamily protein [Iris pallida]|uniref:[RNA-polymerase]-subunit kinase n=1 Tax=Iris pallida TaxID=29817 RepID=A0AAX6IL68_IRIPA|nr:putative protein kinase superfamily protein [Iris pallida]